MKFVNCGLNCFWIEAFGYFVFILINEKITSIKKDIPLYSRYLEEKYMGHDHPSIHFFL